MYKVLGGAAIGIFVGAFVVELIHRMRPGSLPALGSGVGKFASSLGDAFKAGYQGTAKAGEAVAKAAVSSISGDAPTIPAPPSAAPAT